jgi:ribonuclease VapC
MARSARPVIDASALICLVRREQGWQKVAGYGLACVISAVNLMEVGYRLEKHGMPLEEVQAVVVPMIGEVIPFDERQAFLASSIHTRTRDHGLSLADCACLALGEAERSTVITADKKWTSLGLGLQIIQIR